MAVYDFTEDIRDQLALAQTIGGGFGAAMGYRELAKKKRWKEFQEKIRINSEKALIGIIGRGEAEGWDAAKTHQEIIKRIPDAIELETYQEIVMGGGLSTGLTSSLMANLKYVAAEERKARKPLEDQLLSEDEINKNPTVRFWREQKENLMSRINPDWNKYGAPRAEEQPQVPSGTIWPTQPQPTDLIEPNEAELETYRRMGLEEYVSPSGKRYPLKTKGKDLPETVISPTQPKPTEQELQGMMPAKEKQHLPMDEVDVIKALTAKKPKKSVISTKSPQDILSAAQKVTRINSQIKDLKKRFNLNPGEVRRLEELLMNDEPIERVLEWLTTGKVK
jgi:hypothetical protein